MREIKFRAWNKNESCMVYLGHNKCCLHLGHLGSWTFTNYQEEVMAASSYCVEEDILMQYTGLKDKNGKEIYEGDIVREYGSISKDDPAHGCYEPLYRIEYSTDGNHAYYAGYDLNDESLETVCELLGPLEIIGNIYENPELLKK